MNTDQIKVKIIADSLHHTGQSRITTFELEYPRFIHSELMTHRAFSRNAMSSRAIPIAKMIEQVRNNPAMPIEWGKNQAGMQAGEQVDNVSQAIHEWCNAANNAANMAENLAALGLHKQIVNRVLEPFQIMKTVLTGTDFDNFFELRCHTDAQPEMQLLAHMMRLSMAASVPVLLQYAEWHMPYITDQYRDKHTLEDCLRVSASCCAQVSYRALDMSHLKAVSISDKLIGSKPMHASPFEHQAQSAPQGSGNFTGAGFLQLRHIVEQYGEVINV